MKEKIMNVKNMLKIIILIFIIFSCIKSCANARILTKEEIANFMLNAYATQTGEVTETIINKVKNRMATWQSLADITSQYQGYYSLGYNYANSQFFFVRYGGSTTDLAKSGLTAVMFSGNNTYIGKYAYTSGSLTYYYTTYNINSDTLNTSSVSNGGVAYTQFGNSGTNKYWVYTDKTLGSSTAWSVSAGGQRPTGQDLFAENYISSIKWEFIPNSNNTISIPNKTEQYYSMNKGTFNTTLATLQDSSYTDQIMMLIQAYNGTTWEIVTDRELYNNTMIISDTFPSQTDGDTLKSQIQIKSNTIPANSIIVLRAYPNQYIANELGITEIEEYFYITNNKTVITGNTLDLVGTFSGDTDYENEVNQAINNEQQDINDNNLQDITENINKNDSWWRLQFDKLFTLDSGDTEDLKNQIESKINFEEISGISGELIILENIKNAQVGDFIISWQPVMWQNKTIIPSGDINFSATVREIESLNKAHKYAQTILCCAMAFLILHRIWKTLCILLGIGTQVYEQYEDEHSVVEGQNTLYDVNTGVTTYQNWTRQGQNLNIVKTSTGGKKKRK